MSVTVPPPFEDPFFFDREALDKVAASTSVAHGLRYFKERRVIEVDQTEDLLWGTVEDETDELPVGVEIRFDGEGRLDLHCACSEGEEAICRHQVAVLYAYADQKEEAGQVLTAWSCAICR